MLDQNIAPVYILGHLNPDTDSIGSATGYAWLLRERDGKNAIAARPGHLTRQTSWVLQQANIDAPVLIADASPRFERIARTLPPIYPDQSLRAAWQIAATTRSGAPIVTPDGKPAGIITGDSVFRFISRQIDSMIDLESVSVARLLQVPCRDALDSDVPKFAASMRVRDGRRRIQREGKDDLIIINDDGNYYGVCRAADALNPPRMQVILVDHNELSQAIRSLDEADLVEVLDHHRIGIQSTRSPIPFTIDTVGSTCTLVYERIMASGLIPPPWIALVLLAGIVADTLILTSPTTTHRDSKALDQLSSWIIDDGSLRFTDYKSFGEELLTAGTNLSAVNIDDLIQNDLKIYESAGTNFGISQIELGNLLELNGHIQEISEALERLCTTKELAFLVLMATDVVRATSRLIIGGEPELINDLPFNQLPDGTLEAPGVVSRKKQLLPAILGLLE